MQFDSNFYPQETCQVSIPLLLDPWVLYLIIYKDIVYLVISWRILIIYTPWLCNPAL